jgi:hypothetical protein
MRKRKRKKRKRKRKKICPETLHTSANLQSSAHMDISRFKVKLSIVANEMTKYILTSEGLLICANLHLKHFKKKFFLKEM